MKNLFDKIKHYNKSCFRNVVKVSNDFSEITDSQDERDAINCVLNLVGKTDTLNPQIDFYYTAAIGYPFETEHYTNSRYSDGSFPVWYGCENKETTFHETIYHMQVDERYLAQTDHIIYRDRVIYQVHCNGLLIDLSGKQKAYPKLTDNDYTFTHAVGKQLVEHNQSGILSPSARCHGINLNIFNKEVLSRPKPIAELTYELDTQSKNVIIHNHITTKSISMAAEYNPPT